MKPLFRLENIVRRYQVTPGGSNVEALRVPLLEIPRGEIVGVAGANGSGKSTLLETMAFLAKPEEGHIWLDDRDVWADGISLDARRRCPMLLQRTVLLKRTVLKNVMFGLLVRGISRSKARASAAEALSVVGLSGLAERTYRQLSGGEQQRVALARLLALEPDALLLDEPTAHVDRGNAEKLEQAIRRLPEATGTTVVLASHDRRQAEMLTDRVITLTDGRLVPCEH